MSVSEEVVTGFEGFGNGEVDGVDEDELGAVVEVELPHAPLTRSATTNPAIPDRMTLSSARALVQDPGRPSRRKKSWKVFTAQPFRQAEPIDRDSGAGTVLTSRKSKLHSCRRRQWVVVVLPVAKLIEDLKDRQHCLYGVKLFAMRRDQN